MDTRNFDFSKGHDGFRAKARALIDESFKAERPCRTEPKRFTVRLDSRQFFKLTERVFINFVFALISEYGRCFKDVISFPRAIQTAEYAFNTIRLSTSVVFERRLYTYSGAVRAFERYMRDEKQCHPVFLPSVQSRQAVALAASMMLVPEYMGMNSNVVNIMHAHRDAIASVADDGFTGSWGHLAGLTKQVQDYFLKGSDDKQLLRLEHFAAMILDTVFSGEMDPIKWREIAPAVSPDQVKLSRTELFTTKSSVKRVLTHNLVSSGTETAILDAMDAFDDAAVLFVFDAPWFIVHANLSSLLDEPHKVIHCGSEYALAAIVAPVATIELWRLRSLVFGGCVPSNNDRVKEIIGCFWADAKTRFVLMHRLWRTATAESSEPFGLAAQDAMHYECFYCLLPALDQLGGKEMAAAVSVKAERLFDANRARELALSVKGDANALRVHNKSLIRLGRGDASRVDMLYAIAMDPNIDMEWRKELLTFLADSMIWPEGIEFEKRRLRANWPAFGLFEHVSSEVVGASVNNIRNANANPVHNVGSESISDVFYFPKAYNQNQDVVNLRTSKIIDVAYAFHRFPNVWQDPCIIPATRPPSLRKTLAPEPLERMYAVFMQNGEDNFAKLTEEEQAKLYQEARGTPIMTPTRLT